MQAGSRKKSLDRILRSSSFRPGRFVCICLSLLSWVRPALGQSQLPAVVLAQEPGISVGHRLFDQELPGTISGTVVDSAGAVVVAARIMLIAPRRSTPQEALSDENGHFHFANVSPGDFQIRITAAGFAAQTSGGILRSDENYIAPTTQLIPARLNTEVEVTVTPVEVAEAEIKAEEKQRVFGVVPNFYVSYVHDAHPLTARQKLQLAWKSSIDPVTFALTGVTAAVQQAQNAFSGYGQGGQGYAKRFGASYADVTTSTFIGSAILPSLLKQDPRYFYKGTGSVRSRIL